jgi:hypothetical protein
MFEEEKNNNGGVVLERLHPDLAIEPFIPYYERAGYIVTIKTLPNGWTELIGEKRYNVEDTTFAKGGEIKIDGNIFKVKIYLADHSYDRETDKETPMWFCRVYKMNGNDVYGILTEDNDLEGTDIGNFDSRKKAKDFLLRYYKKLNVILLDDNGIGIKIFDSNNPDIRFKKVVV